MCVFLFYCWFYFQDDLGQIWFCVRTEEHSLPTPKKKNPAPAGLLKWPPVARQLGWIRDFDMVGCARWADSSERERE